ncbi:MAG: Holliday junction resolvase RuvX [Gammaproteobacteria bacterium]|nr:Holliday junction resolvase RuvX [Gammaproteobacteria bacterium]|tara:strand:+ start:127 stop:582 length:456 start_codon:yes stop_codon:yes gene_type:complete
MPTSNNLLNKDYMYMSIDYGLKKIGFAVGQLITKKARPVKIINNKNNKEDWGLIHSIIKEWKPNVIVIGYPYSKSKSKLLSQLEKFISKLKSLYKDEIKIVTISEYLSTEESKLVYSKIRESNYNIIKRKDLDDISASLILQSWFNENMIE